MTDHINVFTQIYETCTWGNNNDAKYKGTSGNGSTVNYNINTYIPFLKNFIIEKQIKTVVDLGCGDFRCGQYIYNELDLTYYGYDAYDKVITHNTNNLHEDNKYNFIHLDFLNKKTEIIPADICILKDVIQHWSLIEIYTFLDYLMGSKKFKYILICNCCSQKQNNTNITSGDFRPLSANYFPLKRYKPKIIYTYNTKEVSLIEC